MGRIQQRTLSFIPFIVLLAMILIRTGWISDDAYITLRTISNFASGYGLTWNVGERVQAYTHPLWMFVLGAGIAVTHEFYFTTLAISILISLLVAVVLHWRISQSLWPGIFGIAVLTLSKSFIDFSTSGLENPLSHLLLIAFLAIYLFTTEEPYTNFLLSFIAALAFLARPDAILIYAPALISILILHRSRRTLRDILLGMAPIFAWELFSIVYYGFPFPNTAYAKLNTGIASSEMLEQGFFYLLDSLQRDPLTLTLIFSGVVATFAMRKWRLSIIALGFLLYLAYLLRIGGDFMSGRMLSVLLVGSVTIWVFLLEGSKESSIAMVMLVVLLGLSAPAPTILSRADYPNNASLLDKPWGIQDERAFYFPYTGLMRVDRVLDLPRHEWAYQGQEARVAGVHTVVRGAVGMFGFYAGPGVHVIDVDGLADPLLARLPADRDPYWRIGHFQRRVPEGYEETIDEGKNVIRNESLAAYYNKLRIVTQGDLFSLERWREIVRLNFGSYGDLLEAYLASTTQNVTLEEINNQRGGGGVAFDRSGLAILLPELSFARQVRFEISANQDYQFVFYRDGEVVSDYVVGVWSSSEAQQERYHDVPDAVAASGFDQVKIFPHDPGSYQLFAFALIE